MSKQGELDAFEKWMVGVRRLARKTVEAYMATLDWFVKLNPDGGWDSVTTEDIEMFMHRLRRGGKLGAARTMDRDRAALATFYDWLGSHGGTKLNPVIDVNHPKVDTRNPRPISDDMLRQVWMSPIGDDDTLWFGMGVVTGLRRIEMVTITPAQVDIERGMFLNMNRKGNKEGSIEYREIAELLGEQLPDVYDDFGYWVELVERYAVDRRNDPRLLTWDMGKSEPDPTIINRRLQVVLREAGIPRPLWFSPHALRHTCGTNLARAGVPLEVIADIMGHSHVDTTRVYLSMAGRLKEWRAKNNGS